jgi:zinc protease
VSNRLVAFTTAAICAIALSAPTPAHATNIERVVSPGGIVAWLVRERSVPLIAMDFAFEGGGSSQDPAHKSGVAHMTAALLNDGAGELNASAFHRRQEELALEMRFSASQDHFSGSVRLLKDRQDQSFELLRLALTAPRFDADEVERTRAQIVASLRRASTNPSTIASRLWWKTAFPDHPYGRPSSGTLESLPLIAVDDLKSHARRVLARDRLKIAVVGDIDAATLGGVLDRVFGGLPARSELAPIAPVSMRDVGRRIVVDLDVPQAVLSFGGVGLARKDPDFIPAFIVNHILGGGSMSSRLYNEVRERRGLAYGVYSYLAPLNRAALFMGGTQTRSERAGEALEIIEAEIRRFASEGPTADELAKAKSFLKGSYALNLDTSAKIAGVLLRIQLDDLGMDYIAKRNGLIDAVTLDDAKRVAKRLANGGLLVTVVGRPKGLASKDAGN